MSGQQRFLKQKYRHRYGFRAASGKGMVYMKKSKYNTNGPADRMPDYSTYSFSRSELALNIFLFMFLDAAISILFYRSVIAFAAFLPLWFLFLRERRREFCSRRKQKLLSEFTTGIQLVNASLQAGYAIENTFSEALTELEKIYPEDSCMICEFRHIIAQIRLNVPVETLLLDLGRRSDVEDIINFAEVFQTAKRTGGDMIGIIRGAVTSIQSKKETRDEIEANLSGKISEQRVMSAAPLFLIAYTSITSPGFLDVCYHNTLGIGIMSFCLIIYAAAFLWGKRIMQIDV